MPQITQLDNDPTPNNNDLLVTVDMAAGTTKNISREQFFTGAPLPANTVNGQAIADSAVTMAKLSDDVISSGNNWIRFGDGTQICWVVSDTSSAAMETHGSIFYKDVSVGNWPRPFVSTPTCSVTINNAWMWGNIYNFTATSGGTIRCFRAVTSPTSVPCHAVAVGRWK